MNILAISDIHNAENQLSKILNSTRKYDCVLVAGDFTTHGSIDDVKRELSKIQKIAPKIYAVAGNMDSCTIDSWLVQEGYGLHGKGVYISDFGICGVSAAPISILRTPYELDEDILFDTLQSGWKMIQDLPLKVVLAHTPPFGTKVDKTRTGIHVGSKTLRSFIEKNKPDLYICGHIHEARGIETIGKTTVVNCGAVADGFFSLIEIGKTIKVEMCE
ncbi:MAG: metallophosphoesterase family protein [Bacteroidetes bacterium]|nr:metallophosphoesterase family protein [Bacteroidota bacterium]